jgi:hypothetical protein
MGMTGIRMMDENRLPRGIVTFFDFREMVFEISQEINVGRNATAA